MASLTTEAAASAAAGVASTILGHPLDCVKVRLQTAKQSGGRLTTLGCARQMLQQEGASAFARGVGPPLANAMLLNTVMFVCFAEARRHLPQTTVGSLLAGGFSGVAQAFLTTPLDWLKIQVRVQARFGFGFGLGLGSGSGLRLGLTRTLTLTRTRTRTRRSCRPPGRARRRCWCTRSGTSRGSCTSGTR